MSETTKPTVKTPEKKKFQAPKLTKQQKSLLVTIVVATVVTAFCLASSKVLLSQAIYQGKVISARHKSIDQINKDITSANTLITQYNNVFIGTSPSNILGGQNISDPTAIPPNGDNARIVLDALPSSYDFPALLSSVSKIMGQDGIGSPSIGGSDQSSTIVNVPSSNPQPANIDLTLSGAATYTDAENLLKDLERSIRPFDVTHLTLTGNESSVSIGLTVSTYYQPAKTVSLTPKEIK
jgi:hypothetical protein